MSEKKRFLLRLDAELYGILEKWSADELRSVNGQIEYLLTEAARKSTRLRNVRRGDDDVTSSPAEPQGPRVGD
jgi:hypothetical protein